MHSHVDAQKGAAYSFIDEKRGQPADIQNPLSQNDTTDLNSANYRAPFVVVVASGAKDLR